MCIRDSWWADPDPANNYTGEKQAIRFGYPGGPNLSPTGYGDPDKIRNRVVGIKGAKKKGDDSNKVVLQFGSGDSSVGYNGVSNPGIPSNATGAELRFYKEDGSFVVASINIADKNFNGGNTATALQDASGPIGGVSAALAIETPDYTVIDNCLFELKSLTWGTQCLLPFWNCINYENGVESNRIYDKFNAIKIDNGVKVSAPSPNYKEQHRKHGLTFSGLYNSKNGVNNLNQFIAAEGITKDLNPEYGSIQKLFSRNTDIVTFCEDKVLKILSSKDALFNADGNTQLTATNRVLGQTVPFSGDYRISTNPESFAANEFRCYFVDRARGAVL